MSTSAAQRRVSRRGPEIRFGAWCLDALPARAWCLARCLFRLLARVSRPCNRLRAAHRAPRAMLLMRHHTCPCQSIACGISRFRPVSRARCLARPHEHFARQTGVSSIASLAVLHASGRRLARSLSFSPGRGLARSMPTFHTRFLSRSVSHAPSDVSYPVSRAPPPGKRLVPSILSAASPAHTCSV